MRATLMYGAGDVRVEHVTRPGAAGTADALVRVLRSCICGSDLWPDILDGSFEPGRRYSTPRSAWMTCRAGTGPWPSAGP